MEPIEAENRERRFFAETNDHLRSNLFQLVVKVAVTTVDLMLLRYTVLPDLPARSHGRLPRATSNGIADPQVVSRESGLDDAIVEHPPGLAYEILLG